MAETRSGASPTRDRAAGVFARVLQAWSPPVFARALVRLGLRIDSRRVSKLAFRLGIAAALLAHGLGVAAGQDLIFSHRRHLARGATRCETCHASALTSTAAQDNQLPKEETCLACHGETLEGSGPVRPLTGPDFAANWNGLSMGDMLERTRTTMPMDKPGTLSRQQIADVLSYVLSVNKLPAGDVELPRQSELLAPIKFLAQKPSGDPPPAQKP